MQEKKSVLVKCKLLIKDVDIFKSHISLLEFLAHILKQ